MKNTAQNIPASEIQADFDRIAPLSGENWSHSSHHYPFLLKHVPEHCSEVLDVGCGAGSFSRLLAARAEKVIALDLSSQMIRLAEQRSQKFDNITYVVADATEWAFPEGVFDCIATIATMHHLPYGDMLVRFGTALKPGGVLLILDLYQSSGIADRVVDIINVPTSATMKLTKTGRLREPQAVREAWEAHGRHDFYPTLSAVRDICKHQLPGATVKRHVFWRYSVIWKKPQDASNRGGVGQ